MLILWLVASVVKVQGALHWWLKQQSDQRWTQSDRIRNRLLQDTFALRRSLELSLSDSLANPQARQGWLSQIEQLHHALEALSDALTPPYLEDSLPLALQALIESWRSSHPQINLQIKLPSAWIDDTSELNQTILTLVDELLKIALSAALNPVQVQVTLQAKQQLGELLGELNVQVGYADRASLVTLYRSPELDHLTSVFQFFTSGWCWQRQQHLTAIWQFSWRLPNPPLDSK